MPRLADVIAVLDEQYNPTWAEPWDAVGLVCGEPSAKVSRVLFAVDPVAAVAEEALQVHADLVVTHHPLFLTPVHGIAATTAKGKLVHRLVANQVALHVAHTNADVASPGVSDALAAAVGLGEIRPLFAPLRMESGSPGAGRVGELPESESLGTFAGRVAHALPSTAAGLRIAGDLRRPVRRVAVCGGSGDALLEGVRQAGVDVYLTADLRHHVVSETLEDNGPALIDAAHWATEWPWLADAARRLDAVLDARGTTVEVHVSATVTDPWTAQRSQS